MAYPCGADNTLHDQDWALFQQLEKSMLEDKLYLQADLNRDQVTQFLGIDKNRLAVIMQKFGNGTTLPAYINHLRIHHACQMLKDYPNYTIQAIATDSGFSTLRNCQRLFKDYLDKLSILLYTLLNDFNQNYC